MRFRKLAGLTAGALTAGLLAVPGLTTPAAAASSELELAGEFVCTGSAMGFTLEVDWVPGLTVTADGTEVSGESVSLSAMRNAASGDVLGGGFRVDGIDWTVEADLNGESVELEGTLVENQVTQEPIDLPVVSGSRVGEDALVSGQITGVSAVLDFFVPYTPTTSYSVALTCEGEGVLVEPGPEPSSVTVSQDMSCAFGNFDIAYPAEIEVTADGTDVTATLSDIPPTGMPDFLRVVSTSATVDTTLDGEAVELTGSVTYPEPITNNPVIGMPEVAGERTGTEALDEVLVGDIDVVMSVLAYGPNPSNSSMTCSPVGDEPEPVEPVETTTSLVAVSPSVGSVTLTATVGPAGAAGKVEFLTGATKVGEAAVAAGKASITLTGVAAGSHSYTAKFVPTSADDFVGSTSAVATVTVQAPVRPEPPKPTAAPSKTGKPKANVKKKQVVVKVKVNSKAAVNGKVQIVVKKGKKTVFKKAVKVNKKGVATVKIKSKQLRKKLKSKVKGKYKVNAKYLGTKQIKKSNNKSTFKIK